MFVQGLDILHRQVTHYMPSSGLCLLDLSSQLVDHTFGVDLNKASNSGDLSGCSGNRLMSYNHTLFLTRGHLSAILGRRRTVELLEPSAVPMILYYYIFQILKLKITSNGFSLREKIIFCFI